MVFVEAQGGILHIVQLLEDDGCADDEHDGDRELGDDEDLTEGGGVAAGFEQSFEHFHGLEGAQEKGGVSAGEQADEHGCQQDRDQDGWDQQTLDREMQSGEVIDRWQ